MRGERCVGALLRLERILIASSGSPNVQRPKRAVNRERSEQTAERQQTNGTGLGWSGDGERGSCLLRLTDP